MDALFILAVGLIVFALTLKPKRVTIVRVHEFSIHREPTHKQFSPAFVRAKTSRNMHYVLKAKV